MGIDLLALGNHKIEFNDPNEVVQIFSELDTVGISKKYAEMIKQYYYDLEFPENVKDFQPQNYIIKEYATIQEQFEKEGCVTFAGYRGCGIGSIQVTPKIFFFYPGFRWQLFFMPDTIQEAVQYFADRFFKLLGCTEMIYLPDSTDTSDASYRLLGHAKPTLKAGLHSKTIENTPQTKSLYSDFIYQYDKSYEEVRDQLFSILGKGAGNHEEFLQNENYSYMLKKLV